jgi:hypothetical protein
LSKDERQMVFRIKHGTCRCYAGSSAGRLQPGNWRIGCWRAYPSIE